MTNKKPFVKWVLHGIELPLHQNLIYWTSPTATLEQSLTVLRLFSWYDRLANITLLWRAFHDHFVPHCWGGLFPVLKKVLADKPLDAITGLGLHSLSSLDACLLVMVQESIPYCCIFPCLGLLNGIELPPSPKSYILTFPYYLFGAASRAIWGAAS